MIGPGLKRFLGAMMLLLFALLVQRYSNPVLATFLACQAALCIWLKDLGP